MKLLLIVAALAFSASVNSLENDLECLAKNLYFEARNEATVGIIAVGLVTLNRVKDPRFPGTVCDVVTEGKVVKGQPVKNRCQFSWYCDGLADKIRDESSYERVLKIAILLLDTDFPDITDGALFFHNRTVSPGWKRRKIVVIGNHVFYR
jgi:spore germination cell wall hydrolase CwlJ-like protein